MPNLLAIAQLPEGLILTESCGTLQRLLTWGDYALEEPLLRVAHTVDGPAVLLPNDRYYHWLCEALPGCAARADRRLRRPSRSALGSD
jgi:hypothetical protein